MTITVLKWLLGKVTARNDPLLQFLKARFNDYRTVSVLNWERFLWEVWDLPAGPDAPPLPWNHLSPIRTAQRRLAAICTSDHGAKIL